ncbi:MAG: hypothetical protein EZS28_032602 [Streblomastix strix]|uniref:Uncharacterized protein n=1 Tax=Streblomastix strix TaxID=222440 RepID=A0A5J4UPF1_9EUKA|nr:MAG: hypothetical protein EZS28_032602 [Streblomastix strix]
MDVVERFHEIMKPIIEEEKKNRKSCYLDNIYITRTRKVFFFYPPKNYRSTPIPRPKDLNLSYIQELLNFKDGLAGFINIHPQNYQSTPEVVIGLIIFAAEQILQSEPESQDQEQLTNELERIIADGTDDNGDNDQSDHIIESKHFTNGNDGLGENDNVMQLQATVN